MNNLKEQIRDEVWYFVRRHVIREVDFMIRGYLGKKIHAPARDDVAQLVEDRVLLNEQS